MGGGAINSNLMPAQIQQPAPIQRPDRTIEVLVNQPSQKFIDFNRKIYGIAEQTPKYSSNLQQNTANNFPIFDLSKSKNSLGTQFGKLEGDGLSKGLVIHHTGGRGTVGSIMRIFKERGYPAQFVLDREGMIYRTLPEGFQGQHLKSGQGIGTGFNNKNIEGIEIIAKDSNDFTKKQLETLQKFIQWHSQKNLYDPTKTVFGHGEINPHKNPTEGLTIATETRLKPMLSRKK
jgi:hypothetical protein